ncbi:TlyA family RNA methyltransferase [Sessilibacter corallicola]|uniref:TlyA family RNA methyltransferase n=1 Tax=Sessilibacter corallicola TaxID=2904075 RepID=UPI001E5CA8E5|nr:TlyA family RNA methyltransferase [Sessilibacter corallicola]MCE2027943.1 TlyA family RNA methyltransferase [Sessilibacter corallicola]
MIRADVLLVEGGWVSTRALATRLIKSECIHYFNNGQWQLLKKPSLKLEAATQFKVNAGEEFQYVSRGALKLKAALDHLELNVTGMNALDVGQSTGGFTDILVQNHVNQVVGVDVGHDQLAVKLRENPRVACLEGVNARDLPSKSLLEYSPSGFDVVVMDVSFISQSLILPNLPALMKTNAWLISLVKPQFEVGRDNIGKGGLVRDTSLYAQVLERISGEVAALGLRVHATIDSPIKGGDGNREFILMAQRSE